MEEADWIRAGNGCGKTYFVGIEAIENFAEPQDVGWMLELWDKMCHRNPWNNESD